MREATGGNWFYKLGVDQMCAGEVTTLGMVAANRRENGHDVAYWIFSDADTHGCHEADARLMTVAPELLEVVLQTKNHLELAGIVADATSNNPLCRLLARINSVTDKALRTEGGGQ